MTTTTNKPAAMTEVNSPAERVRNRAIAASPANRNLIVLVTTIAVAGRLASDWLNAHGDDAECSCEFCRREDAGIRDEILSDVVRAAHVLPRMAGYLESLTRPSPLSRPLSHEDAAEALRRVATELDAIQAIDGR